MPWRLIAAGLIVVIVIGVVVAAGGCTSTTGAPNIPANHQGRTTCFECHQNGTNGAPKMPQWHLDRIKDGRLSNNLTNCLECHKQS
ncbi:MAG: hypothetical protein ACXVIF_01920 [Halobacteriota archaeon]